MPTSKSSLGRLPGDLAIPADLTTWAFFTGYDRHYLFFRELTNGMIGVMAILHERMDIPVRLLEDLVGIADRLGDG